ncbi:hypothetical protein [Dyella sp.]|uniref:hypothetical protein n=1 Tax=Dyella sp. TaxID=1869338 RepID=UPI002B4A99B4|nr:hypothetical protein [Dyella sp.]HKT29753.1 hypothetical protein [Dyella sp.]
MTDTIDLLEAIGRDASLRHASTEELTKVLVKAQASEALKEAVAFSDSLRLSRELGPIRQQSPQVNMLPDDEERPEEEEPLEGPLPTPPSQPSRN